MIKRHPYIAATVIATVLSIVVWAFVPKEYAAVTKVSDEYKETDLAIGLDKLTAKLMGAIGSQNEGINDIGVYCKVLKTEDFARYISTTKVPGKNITYGQWVMQGRHFWQSDDVIALVSDNIEYNVSTKQQTLTIQFTDRDPLVASLMLEVTVKHLQDLVTASRHGMANALMQNADKQRKEALAAYHRAQEKYATYADSNKEVNLEQETLQQKSLQDAVDLTYKRYQEVSDWYIRQMALKQRAYCSFAVIEANVVPLDDDSHLASYLIPFVFVTLILITLYKCLKSKRTLLNHLDIGGLFAPWTLTISVWLGIFLLLAFSGNMMDPLSENFIISICLWIGIFVPSSYVTYIMVDSKERREFDVNLTIFNILYVIAMIITPLYLYQIYKLVVMFDTQDLMTNMRVLAVKGDGYGLLNYTFVVNEVLLLTGLWLYPRIQWWKLFSIMLACLMYAIGNMEKISVFLLVLSSIYVLYERKVIKIKTIVTVSIIGLLAFYSFNIARASEDSDYSKNESLLDFIGMYVMSGPVAFGHLTRTISDQFGSDSLWGIYLYLSKYITGSFTPHQTFQEFVFVPMATNVYTILRPYYTDFGFCGIGVFALLYGTSLGYIYRQMKNGNTFFVALYTYFVYVLVLQFFDEFVTSTLPLFGQMLVLLTLLTQKKLKISLHG